ncbi:MAG: HIT family hydrolase [Vulcanisaeta sp. JCHS_4]|jgi:ATP adenylyltransferase|nr:MAG: HIT family hydrolase [Vulcanisaeta sp. JCHS_4]
MEVVFTPWRWSYIKSTNNKESGCALCAYLHVDDELVVYRGKRCFIVMNKYPYNIGHVMVVPNRHVPSITDLDSEELRECTVLLTMITRAITEVLGIDYEDLDIGINIGRVAGAGIEEHMHIHIVPKPSTITFKDIDPNAVAETTKEVAAKLRDAVHRFMKVHNINA